MGLMERKDPRRRIKAYHRIPNMIKWHFRGLIGLIVMLASLALIYTTRDAKLTVKCIWLWVFVYFLIHPMNIQISALVPVFMLPLGGIMNSASTCDCYFNEAVGLFILGSMASMALNNSGMDRRIALKILCAGKTKDFTSVKMCFKASMASFLLSIISNKLLSTAAIMQYLTGPLTSLQASSRVGSGPNYEKVRHVIINSVQTSSNIGGLVFLHSATTTIIFKAVFDESAGIGTEFPQVFNYLQYTLFVFPLAIFMLMFNLIYHFVILKREKTGKSPPSSRTDIQKSLQKQKSDLGPMSSHETLSLIITILMILLLLLRWPRLFPGWTAFRTSSISTDIPFIKDATVMALFVVLMHIVPHNKQIFTFLRAKKKSQLPPLKPCSSVLWWKFVDKNSNYSYVFMIGCAVALSMSVRRVGINVNEIGGEIMGLGWIGGIFIVVLISTVLANAMSGVAACTVLMPLFSNMILFTSEHPWPGRYHLVLLGAGLACSLGFMVPFDYTPAFLCHNTGKVPKKRMALLGAGSAIICMLILWLGLAFYGPVLWGDIHAIGLAPVTGSPTVPPPPP